MYGFTLAISCCVKTSNIPGKFAKYIDVPLFKALKEICSKFTRKQFHSVFCIFKFFFIYIKSNLHLQFIGKFLSSKRKIYYQYYSLAEKENR